MANLTSISNNVAAAAVGANSAISFTLHFDAPVDAWGDINNQLYLLLNNGASADFIDNGTNYGVSTVSFNYTTAPGQDVADLRVTGVLFNSGDIVDDISWMSVNFSNIANVLGANTHFAVDTTPPAVTVALANDTGSSPVDGITNNPSLTGSGDPNATVIIRRGASIVTTTTADATGHWSVPTAALSLANGTYTLTASETDAAGNTGSHNVTFTLDTTPPAVTAALAHDTGSSAVDHITNDPTLTGSGDPNATVHILNGGVLVGTTTANASGNWTIPGAALNLADGTYTLTASETDTAGNTGSHNVDFTLDTTPPAVNFALAHDNGISAVDGISNDATLTGTGDPNALVSIRNGAALVTTTTADGTGQWTIPGAALNLADGTYTLNASETDAAGNTGWHNFAFTLDTIPPAAVTVTLTHDNGPSNTDGVTNDDSLNGTADPNATVIITADGTDPLATTTADATGHWSVSGASLGLPDDFYLLYAQEADVAGNTGSASVGVTLDTSIPPAPVVALADNTSLITNVNYTSDGNLAVSGIDAGATVQYSVNNGVSWTSTFTPVEGNNTVQVRQTSLAGNVSDPTSLSFTLDTILPPVTVALANDTGASATDRITNDPTLTGTADPNATIIILGTDADPVVSDANGHWTATAANLGLVDGTYTLTAEQSDPAGNVGTQSITFTLDTTPPNVTVALAHDTGSSAADGITNNATLTGSGDPNATVSIRNHGTLIATAVADASGIWTIPGSNLELDNGEYTLTASETDAAGNTGSQNVTFALDTVAPPAPVVALAHDTGYSLADRITNEGTLAVSGIEPGATVQYSTTQGETWWPSFTPVEGVNHVEIRQTDLAGNTSAPATLAFTFDTVAPPAPVVALAHDTGSSLADRITNDGTLAVSGIEPGATVQYSTTEGETWQPDFTPAEGVNHVEIRQTDLAGNNSANTLLSFTLDTATPAAPTISTTGGLTEIHNQTLQGTGPIGSSVQLFDGTTPLGTVQIGQDGLWAIPVTLASGAHQFTAVATSVSGSVSASSTPVNLNYHPPIDPVTSVNLPIISTSTIGDFGVINVNVGLSGTTPGDAYSGPVTNLMKQFIWNGTEQVSIAAHLDNVFIHGGSGDDALQVKGGSNVLDGGAGSNFLVGAPGIDNGKDTFFVDARTTAPTWSTIVDFHAGDQMTIWGFNDSNSRANWAGQDGVSAYTGATLRAQVNGHDSSVTFAGITDDQANAFTFHTGSVSGQDYLLVTRTT